MDYKTLEFKMLINQQSPEIAHGVHLDKKDRSEMGAGDQGIMFGYASDETEELFPITLQLSHLLVETLSIKRKNGEIPWLRPDAKSQVTFE